ncbi:MAG: uncharacterized protein PWP15_197 [Methanothermococcus sp.]|jgi:hypothetical protein|uniref:DUF366 family protein n=1 Tax=Methanothermococcus TaxID=155862 RepID=UPI00036798C8|nr:MULTISPECIES: DUF366 family protein [Methanothermococcus]MDK2789690.1 uncharacterized protein [Methanothermococcus sp.]MDK2987457.1 uncharacterized protein [Methanothermococcus sp.]
MVEIIDFDNISVVIVDKEMKYTGKEIEPLWAFKTFNIQKDSIVVFKGPMEVKIEDMKDLKDVKEESEYQIPIKSSESINYIVEHFDNPDLKITYLRQRILVSIAKEVIEEMGNIRLKREGDDLYFEDKKLSVCIACRGVSSGKIHLGINVKTEGTPEHVNATGLNDIGVKNIEKVMEKIATLYAKEMTKIEKDMRKTMVLI